MDNNIVAIDKNFVIETSIEREGLRFFDAEDAPFRLHGIFKENNMYRRMPEEVARSVSEGVYSLHTHTAGGRVRFVTDSPYVAIKTIYGVWKMPHCALTGGGGFDIYGEWNGETRYAGTFIPPIDVKREYEAVVDFAFGIGDKKVVTINFPLYSSVKKLYIGLKEGSVLMEAPDYTISTPVVYYGSSITQGGCASKPGSSYQSILSRRFDCDYINLGFSGSAKAEDEMIDYVKNLDMSIFVLDYDHNSPDAEHLKATHEKMFKAVREAKPQVPILILPRPRYYFREEDEQRFKVIYQTYLNAKKNGDENVYFIDGKTLMALVGDNGSVDNTHPTDSGFLSMAIAIGRVFEEILKKQKN